MLKQLTSILQKKHPDLNVNLFYSKNEANTHIDILFQEEFVITIFQNCIYAYKCSLSISPNDPDYLQVLDDIIQKIYKEQRMLNARTINNNHQNKISSS